MGVKPVLREAPQGVLQRSISVWTAPALIAALAVLVLTACASTPDDARIPPPTTTPIPAQAAATMPAPPAATAIVAPIVTAVIATPTPVPRETAPDFDLPAAGGGSVSLSQMLDGKRAAVLVFYRGLF